MRSLLLRIFLSFWLIIALTIVVGVTLGVLYADRVRQSMEAFEVSDAMVDANRMLAMNGRAGLEEWLDELPIMQRALVFVIDEDGDDLLERDLPDPVRVGIRRQRMMAERPPEQRGPVPPFLQLRAPDGEQFTLVVLPMRSAMSRFHNEQARWLLVLIALLVSAVVSFFLARAMSRPIRRFRESADAIASGNLDTRVAGNIEQRKDEIGGLARDFNRMAEQLQRAWTRQSELTSNVSHELRSPLARLRVALELARRRAGELPEFDRIDTETERLDALIGQILDFSRLEQNPMESPVPYRLDELVAVVVGDAAFEFPDATIDLSADSVVTVQGYPEAMRSALENLVRNAVQHGGGGVTVTLTAENSDCTVVVCDHGGGLPDMDLEKVFEPFYRSHAGSADSGTGLGLAIAARAVALNGGGISAANRDDGLCVTVTLKKVT